MLRDILDEMKQMSDEEVARGNAEWRAVYGKLDPFAVAPFMEYYGAPLSKEGHRLASLLNRAIHGRLPITREIRFELVHFLAPEPTKDIDRHFYGMALHRQNLISLLERYDRRIRTRGHTTGRRPASGRLSA
jgi:hypothetical protein